jgi:uncharacterized membrane protein
MNKLTKVSTAALATVALLPASAMADVSLKGQPSLTKLNKTQAMLVFRTDEELPRRANGGLDVAVFAAGGSFSVASHSHDLNKHHSYLRSQHGFRVGQRVRVRIAIKGQDSIVRRVTVRRAR